VGTGRTSWGGGAGGRGIFQERRGFLGREGRLHRSPREGMGSSCSSDSVRIGGELAGLGGEHTGLQVGKDQGSRGRPQADLLLA
jgi:hypothetical protein